MITIEDIQGVLRDVLQIGERAGTLQASTPLLGSIPEFDSMAVVSVINQLEERFGIVVDDDEISADTFETLGSLHAFVAAKLAG
jgi:acyl carrier protein